MAETEIGVNTEVNLYWAGASASNGFHVHWDSQDVFVLQLQGTKRWKIYEPNPTFKLPFARHKPNDWNNNEALAHAPDAEPILEIELKPGDKRVIRSPPLVALLSIMPPPSCSPFNNAAPIVLSFQ
jgi:ribosomal protein L16 Arg81 hydroxylase